MDSLTALWWERLPNLGNRFSRLLGAALGEGVYLTAWPRFAALAPISALLFGIAAGWLRVRTDSLYPPMILHMLFNGLALILAVTVETNL